MAHIAAPDVLPVEPSLDIVNRRADSDLSSLDDKLKDEYGVRSETSSLYDRASAGPLAPSDVQPYTAGAAILHFLHIRRRPKDYDLDAVSLLSELFFAAFLTILTIAHVVYRSPHKKVSLMAPLLRTTSRTTSTKTRTPSIRLSAGRSEKSAPYDARSTSKSSYGC